MAIDENFTGFKYLLDAGNSRQYAVRYEDGSAKSPLQVFAQDQREAGFGKNERIFAFDDDSQHSVGADGKVLLNTTAYQINTNEEGRPSKLLQVDVSYELQFAVKNGKPEGTYVLTAASKEGIEEMGLDASFPTTFKADLDPSDPGLIKGPNGNFKVSPALVQHLPFPPHQDGSAFIARMSVQQNPTTQEPKVLPKNPSTTFNGSANGNPAKPQPPKNPKITDAALEQALREYTEDLTEKAKNGKLDPVVGRDDETKNTLRILSRRKQASVAFTGDAGVGKTAMFSAISQAIVDKSPDVPESLEGARVLQMDIQKMLAGAKFRGQFEERLKPIIDGLQEREGWFKGQKIIIAIDEIHNQLGAGKNGDDAGSAGNMMKPFLVSRGISVMGTTTGEEYRKHIEKDPALARRFQQMVLGQPNREATLFITEKLWPGIKAHHGITEDISKKDLEYIVDMTNRYAPAISQPSKAETALDDAAANAKQRHSNVLERQDIVAAVAQMSKLSVDFLSQNDSDRFLKMEKELPEQVLGQPGIQRVVDGLIGSRSGLSDPNQPWAAFVFQGPTGTGKTELSKALARYLFGDEGALIQLNMGDYAEKHTVSRLIGAPPGYVGFEDSEPALTERIRQRPYSILLLDEIEKAHPDVFNVLLPVLNDGVMTDNHGKKVLFNNVIVVMTTNLGAKEAMAYLNGGSGGDFGIDTASNGRTATAEEQEEKLSGIYAKKRKEFFRPEMINRIEELGGFVTFIPLAQEVITKLVSREIEKVNKRLSDPTGALALNPSLKDVTIEVGADARIQLAAEGYKPDMGARPLRKVVREKISNPLGKWLMANKENIAEFVEKNGPAKIVINKLPTKESGFEPELVATTVTAEVSNDNKAQAAAPAKKNKRGAPTL